MAVTICFGFQDRHTIKFQFLFKFVTSFKTFLDFKKFDKIEMVF